MWETLKKNVLQTFLPALESDPHTGPRSLVYPSWKGILKDEAMIQVIVVDGSYDTV